MTALSRPLFKYFGSKFQIASSYPQPRYDRIDEDFAGSAAYSCQYPEREIVLHEIDPDVAGLWEWLIGVDPEVILSLPCESLVPGQDLRDLELPGKGADLIRRWQRVGRNDCWTVSKWNGANSGLWHPRTRREIAKNVTRIRHWKVINSSWDAAEPVESTRFVDPPYQCICRQQSPYRFTAVDYGALAEFCRNVPGQAIVCEQRGADWLPFRDFRVIAARCAANRKPGAKSREVIWTNDPARQEELFA